MHEPISPVQKCLLYRVDRSAAFADLHCHSVSREAIGSHLDQPDLLLVQNLLPLGSLPATQATARPLSCWRNDTLNTSLPRAGERVFRKTRFLPPKYLDRKPSLRMTTMLRPLRLRKGRSADYMFASVVWNTSKSIRWKGWVDCGKGIIASFQPSIATIKRLIARVAALTQVAGSPRHCERPPLRDCPEE